MTSFSVSSLLAYLTVTDGVAWRSVDYDVNKMVKCLKGEPIKGYFTIKIGGKSCTFNESTRDHFLGSLCNAVASKIGSTINGKFTLVPVPNSAATTLSSAVFRTQEVANRVAQSCGGLGDVSPVLRWKSAMLASRKGGTRDPQILLENLELLAVPARPIVLFDDVMTTGAHMTACRSKFIEAGLLPVFSIVVGRSTWEQKERPIQWVEEMIDCGDAETAWDFDL